MYILVAYRHFCGIIEEKAEKQVQGSKLWIKTKKCKYKPSLRKLKL